TEQELETNSDPNGGEQDGDQDPVELIAGSTESSGPECSNAPSVGDQRLEDHDDPDSDQRQPQRQIHGRLRCGFRPPFRDTEQGSQPCDDESEAKQRHPRTNPGEQRSLLCQVVSYTGS